ncbi:MAG: branched-chain amino acid ABC transporter permease [Desulfuromonadales bacterium]
MIHRIPIILRGTTIASLVTLILLPLVLPSASLATEVLIFAIAVLGCNLLLGYTGLLSFGQGIFFGLGAYTASLCLIRLGTGLLSSLGIAVIAGGVVAAAVGSLSIRRRGIYFVMLTLAFSQMAYFVASTSKDITGGENGLLDVPRPPLVFFGMQISSLATGSAFYAFVAVIFIVLYVALRRVIHSPFGSTLLAIRENEERALAVGYNTRYFKIMAFAMSGGITALAGALYAISLHFAPLSNIEFVMSEQIVLMTIIGGTGSLYGSLLGAGFMVVAGEALSAIWPRWMLLLGIILIAIVMFMRGGLWGGVEQVMNRFRSRKPQQGQAPPLEVPND